jgi:nucleoside-diphosphate-sugar epimerase
VVLLSSIGAHLRKGAGLIDGLADMEQIFSNLPGVNVIALRAAYFMENVLSQVDIIKNMGVIGSALKGDLDFPMVASKDIADVATKHLQNLDFKGFSVEYILGPRNYTYNEIASIIGRAIGKPDLKYVQFSYEDTENSFRKMGIFSDNVIQQFIEMEASFNNNSALSDYKRTEQNSTPTTFEEFAQSIAGVYEEASASKF